MHQLNTKYILRVIREQSPISRSEIVEKTDLTAATVSRIVNKLIKFKLVTETGYAESKGGRKAVLLELIAESVLTIGIDIEIDEIAAVVIDLDGNTLLDKQTVLKGKIDKEYILTKVKEIITFLLSDQSYSKKIIGIGIGMHGLVDSENGVSIFPPAFGWTDFPLASIISEEYALPVSLENNVRALTLAEKWFGLAKNLNNFICLKLGTGIGSGIYINDNIYRGSSNSAGEIGHTMVDENGPLCTCGNYGCLESMASIPAIIKRTAKALKQGAASEINSLIDNKIEELNLQIIIQAAKQGDHLSRQILQEVGHYLGISISSLVNILNPEAVIISGELVRAGDFFMASLKSTLENRALTYPAKHFRIINSNLGKNGVAIGAATLILESVFNIDKQLSVDIGL